MKKVKYLSSYERDYFLFYQFIPSSQNILSYQKNEIFKGLSFLETSDLVLYNTVSYFQEHYWYLQNKKIAIFFSWWIDSFFLLSILQKAFPWKVIELFIFFLPWEEEKVDILKKYINWFPFCTFSPFELDTSYQSFCQTFSHVYKDQSQKILWDEWFFMYLNFFKVLKSRKNIDIIFTWDGIDVLFGWLDLYKYAQIENGIFNEETILEARKKEYFLHKKAVFWENFHYKYWEYFWGDFIETKSLENEYLSMFSSLNDEPLSLLQKQIFIGAHFWIPNRKDYIYDAAKYFSMNIIAPFTEERYIQKLSPWDIPNEYILDERTSKKIIRHLSWIQLPSFSEIWKLNMTREFSFYKKDIFYKGSILYRQWLISKEHLSMLPYFIKQSHRYENRMRIYLLLQLYFYINS